MAKSLLPGAVGVVAVIAGAIGIIVGAVDPTPLAALLATQALGPGRSSQRWRFPPGRR